MKRGGVQVVVISVVAGAAACVSAQSVRQSSPEAAQKLDCIAVLPFENHSGAAEAGHLVAHELATALVVSERFNIVQPSEAEHLLRRFGLDSVATNRVALAQLYGRRLGVQGVMIGSVAEYDRHDLTSRTAPAEPVVGFLSRIVDTRTGDVVWTSHTSAFDYAPLLAVPHSQGSVLRQAVASTVDDLVGDRRSPAGRGLCAGAYAQVERGDMSPTVVVPANPVPYITTLPSLPAMPPDDRANLPPPQEVRALPAMPPGQPPAGPVYEVPGPLPEFPELPPSGAPGKLPKSPDVRTLPPRR